MDRIAPEAVVAAFRKHPEIRPVTETFIIFDWDDIDRVVGCCGSAALALDAPGLSAPLLASADLPGELIAEKFGLASEYVEGFIAGWDDEGDRTDIAETEIGPDYSEGYRDGLAAWDAVAADREGID